MQPAVMDAVHAELLRALGEHPELRGTLLVVEAARHRIRRFVLPAQ
jgi:hypothetical protein